jgi:hypothetical protein
MPEYTDVLMLRLLARRQRCPQSADSMIRAFDAATRLGLTGLAIYSAFL